MMGRPPKPPKDVKASTVAVRFTKAERARIDRAAKVSGETVSTWARAVILGAADQLLRKG